MNQTLIDLFGLGSDLLKDGDLLRGLVANAIESIGAETTSQTWSQLPTDGILLLVSFGDSHVSIHTYPVTGLAIMNIVAVDGVDKQAIIDYILGILSPEKVNSVVAHRGMADLGITFG